MIDATASASSLTPSERYQILRRLKYGPALPRAELVEYANRLKREAVANRKEAISNKEGLDA